MGVTTTLLIVWVCAIWYFTYIIVNHRAIEDHWPNVVEFHLLLTGFSKIAKLLYLLDDCFQNFCDIEWLGVYGISATTSDYLVAEFLRQLVI